MIWLLAFHLAKIKYYYFKYRVFNIFLIKNSFKVLFNTIVFSIFEQNKKYVNTILNNTWWWSFKKQDFVK